LDDAAVAALVVERGVTIEACPTSNVHTGVIASVASHPLRTWIQRGIRCCVNTDNTLLSDVTLPAELDRTRAALGLDDREIAALVDAGHRAGFRR
jgi:adenosine deaminase